MKIGTKRLGMFVQYARDAANNPCVYAVCWRARGKRLRYWYPAITLIGWKPVFSIQ